MSDEFIAYAKAAKDDVYQCGIAEHLALVGMRDFVSVHPCLKNGAPAMFWFVAGIDDELFIYFDVRTLSAYRDSGSLELYPSKRIEKAAVALAHSFTSSTHLRTWALARRDVWIVDTINPRKETP